MHVDREFIFIHLETFNTWYEDYLLYSYLIIFHGEIWVAIYISSYSSEVSMR